MRKEKCLEKDGGDALKKTNIDIPRCKEDDPRSGVMQRNLGKSSWANLRSERGSDVGAQSIRNMKGTERIGCGQKEGGAHVNRRTPFCGHVQRGG